MQQTLTAPPSGFRESGQNSAFNVLIAYEDFAAGKHAKHTYDFLADQLGPDCSCTSQMWKFGVLEISKLREIAAQDARTADIIMISCSGEDLPASVKAWIEDWLPQAHNTLALVALFSPAQGPMQSWPVRTYLADVARRGGFEFFAQPDVWPGHRGARAVTLNVAQPNEPVMAKLMSAFEPESKFPRWGLNE